jgi:hypothetical protein
VLAQPDSTRRFFTISQGVRDRYNELQKSKRRRVGEHDGVSAGVIIISHRCFIAHGRAPCSDASHSTYDSTLRVARTGLSFVRLGKRTAEFGGI